MRKRKASRPHAGLDYLADFMKGLQEDRKRLTEIQSAYDNLSLLGQLLCAGTDITAMRQDFHRLAGVLLEQLAREHYSKAVLGLGANARVAIDVLTRNLFERTADIGFLATDADICAYAEALERDPATRGDAAWRQRLQARFAEYVEKYSVYHNIVLLSPSGEVLVQLDDANPVALSADPLIREALTTEAPYVEVFRPTDLLPDEASPLLYAYRVMSADGSHPVGVLCLCFRFHDECRRIFDSLVADDDWTVITLLDKKGRIIASSDQWQFPLGAQLEAVTGDECRIVRFAGREYLATSRPTQGYQGYAVPGWVGHTLAPLNHAFEQSTAHELEHVPEDFLDCVLATTDLLGPELKAIPRDAARIQGELNRAVWNGHVWLCRDPAAARNAAFAKVLLREIGSTGVRTHDVFGESITNLYKTVVSSALYDCGTQAALAIDIMDRSLYERANDCRWWALTSLFREELRHPAAHDKAQRQRLTDVLRQINRLYTVYSNLVLFDRGGRVLAVSNPAYNDWIGRPIDASWVRPTLGLPDTQSYTVSAFEPSPLYDGQPTYIHAAAIREADGGDPVGGIAVVFDAACQFRAMLHDALPRRADGTPVAGAFAVFAERDGRVVASTDPEIAPGTPLMVGYEFFNLPHGESCTNVIIYDGRYYAVGSTMSAGYREYRSGGGSSRGGVVALVFLPLSERVIDPNQLPSRHRNAEDSHVQRVLPGERCVDIACFHIGRNWYGIPSQHVIEAIDSDRLTPIPGLPDMVCGCVMHGDQAISVLDLSAVLAPHHRAENERRRAPEGGRRQIVVLRSPDRQTRFGLLVDQLSAVRDVPEERIEPLPDMMSEGNSLIESLVKPVEGEGERRILIVLSVARLLQRLGRGSAAPAWLPALLGKD